MKISDKIKSLIRRRPLTVEELAARSGVEEEREEAIISHRPDGGWDPGN
jgi:hypothetical protein